MATSLPPKKKPLKDINSVDRAIFLRTTVLILKFSLFFLPIFIFKFGYLGFLYWFLAGTSLSILVECVLNAIGSTAGRLYTGRKADWSLREKLAGDLSAVRVQKMKGYPDKALELLESILARDPSYAEALFVKAQILDESYDERKDALSCLNLAIRLSRSGEPTHKWAKTLKQQLENKENG